MKVLLTGHLGYIGSILAPMLLERGHAVTGLDSDLYRTCNFGTRPVEIPTIGGDVRDVRLDELTGFDAVIHLAGLSNDPLGDMDPALTDEINHRACARLARLAKAAGVARFLFASTCANYGGAGDAFLREDAPFGVARPYGLSKVDAERALRAMADETFSPTFLRASTAYGLSPRIRFDLVVNNLTAWAFATGEVYLKSDGAAWRPVVHVEDIARAYVSALEADRALVHDQAFNVGATTENYRVREIAELVQAVVPNSRVTVAPDATADSQCYRADCNHIGRVLHDYKPQWTARRGIEQLHAAYRQFGLELEDFEGDRYQRRAHVARMVREGEVDRDLRRVHAPAQAVAA